MREDDVATNPGRGGDAPSSPPPPAPAAPASPVVPGAVPPASSSAAPANPPADGGAPPPPSGSLAASPSSPRDRAPEPPRWRFVEEARKTRGYSSEHAGFAVTGLSGEELAGKFVAPERKSLRRFEATPEAAGADVDDEVGQREGQDVGRLGGADGAPREEEGAGARESRKRPGGGEEEEAGSADDADDAEDAEDASEEDESEDDDDADEEDVATPEEAEAPSAEGEAGTDGASDSDEGAAEAAAVAVAEPEGEATGPAVGPEPGAPASEVGDGKSAPDEEERPPTRRKRLPWLLLLLLLASAAIATALGLTLGRKPSRGDVGGDEAIDAAIVVDDGNDETESPSGAPAALPADDGALASIAPPTAFPTSLPSRSPAAVPSLAPSAVPSEVPSTRAPVVPPRDVVHPDGDSVVPCRETIEAELAGRIDGLDCAFCGFCTWKSTTFDCYERVDYLATRYGTSRLEARRGLCERDQCKVPSGGLTEEVLRLIESGTSRCGDVGEAATVLPTSPPAARPTSSPTPAPTPAPTSEPTGAPAPRPTLAPSPAPTPKPWAFVWLPTPEPTPGPTNPPTCNAEQDDFNLCVAIDMSGSVCNQGTGFECKNCEPELICNDNGLDSGSCCTNFLDVLSFVRIMIVTLEASIPSDQLYSIVGFGTEATSTTPLRSPRETLQALSELAYLGGTTNHADAINACASSFEGGVSGMKNLILLITDGMPSDPRDGSPRAAAEEAAAAAKAEGTLITPVMIAPFSPEPITYLSGISSNGVVFDVSDFTVLDDLRENLLVQISCQV